MSVWKENTASVGSVGLVGCGRMGRCMLECIQKGGFSVTVYDKFPQAAEAARQMGAKVAETPAALAAGVDMILMSLPGPAQLEEVLFGQDGLVQALTADHVVVDTSTVDPATSRANAERVAVSGAAYLDCPILGRPSAAGRWMLPTGGDPQALRYVQPVLLTFAANAVHVGGSGSGNALKLLNQLRQDGAVVRIGGCYYPAGAVVLPEDQSAAVTAYLAAHGTAVRKELAELLNLPPAQCTALLRRMADRGELLLTGKRYALPPQKKPLETN